MQLKRRQNTKYIQQKWIFISRFPVAFLAIELLMWKVQGRMPKSAWWVNKFKPLHYGNIAKWAAIENQFLLRRILKYYAISFTRHQSDWTSFMNNPNSLHGHSFSITTMNSLVNRFILICNHNSWAASLDWWAEAC